MPKLEVFETCRTRTGSNAPNPSGLYARQQFETGLQWLESQGVEVQRHAISVDDPLVIDNSTVKTALELQGEDALPITVLDDTIISIGGYPTRAELLAAAGYRASDDPEFLREAAALTAGMSDGLSINDLPRFRLNYDRARLLGLPVDDLRDLIESAKAAAGEAIRDETLTKVEQFLAFGPAGKLKAPRCSCSGNS